MGKRSDFKRIPRDFYPTPREAVVPLLPHLPKDFTYWEPCAGDGALIRHLPGVCGGACDIEPRGPGIGKADVLRGDPVQWVDFIITNPPWDRKVLHPMIQIFSAARPTWLLFDADWVHTKQSAPFMPWLRKIVSVGRVKWIPDSKMTGKDNCAWHLFDQNTSGPCEFVGRGQAYEQPHHPRRGNQRPIPRGQRHSHSQQDCRVLWQRGCRHDRGGRRIHSPRPSDPQPCWLSAS